MEYITRRLEKVFKRLNSNHQVVLLTGARQVGKLSMLSQLAEGQNRIYVSLNNISARNLAKNDPELFFQIYKPPMIIDGIHLEPELVDHIDEMCDESENMGLFWLTGVHRQSAIDIIRERLGSKVAITRLETLSFNEIRANDVEEPVDFNYKSLKKRSEALEKNDITKIFEHIWHGGMAELVEADNKKYTDFYNTYIDTFTMLDGAELGGITDFPKFRRFMEAAAAMIGDQVNYKVLAEEADISQPTSKEWLNILEEMGLVFLLHPFEETGEKRIVKSPKLYFSDTGLSAFLGQWPDKGSLMVGPLNRRYFENFVVAEIHKNFIQSHEDTKLTYYKDSNGKEIDLIVEKSMTLHPFLIKKTTSPDINEIWKFQVLDQVDKKRGKGGILCLAKEVKKIDEDNLVIPCNLF